MDRWLKIEKHLEAEMRTSSFQADLAAYLEIQLDNKTSNQAPDASKETPSFLSRMSRQLSKHHWMAYYLNPCNDNMTPDPEILPIIQGEIKTFGGEEALKQYRFYRNKEGVFYNASCWSLAADPEQFWLEAVFVPLLISSWYEC
jgi:hypothetical protein